jgi:acylphosphatase
VEIGRKAILVRITGRVQGVYFRAWTRSEAEKLGLKGWVRNEDDGSVRALIVGPDAAVSAMMKRFWEGPSGAKISSVVPEEKEPSEVPAGFRITG